MLLKNKDQLSYYLSYAAVLSSLVMNYGSHLFVMSFFFNVLFLITKSKVGKLKISTVCILILYIASIFFTIIHYQGLLLKLYISNLLYIFNALLLFFVLTSLSKENLIKILKSIISLMIFILIFQHILYITTSIYLDLHKIFTIGAYESRFEGGMFNRFGLIRATGFSVEPSNFSILIIYLAFFHFLVSRNIKIANYQLIGSCLTLSFAAIGIVSVLLVLLNYKKLFNLKLKNILFFLCFFCLSLLLIILFYYRMTAGVGYDAVGSRLILFSYLKEQPIDNFLLGNGTLFYSGKMDFNNFSLTEAQIKDTGLLVNMLFSFGIFGLLAFLIYVFKFSGGQLVFYFSILLMMTKFDYGQPIFWLFVFLMPYLSKKYRYE